MNLAEKKCVPCEGGVSPFSQAEIDKGLQEVDSKWSLENGKITRTFNFVNFAHNMDFINKMAKLAEEEGHHPDFFVSYATCKVTIWTHAIDGLSENDFILAAKIDNIV